MRCGTIGSCQSAATSEIVKALLVASLTRVSVDIVSVLTFTFMSPGCLCLCTFLPSPLTSSWRHLRCDVGLEEEDIFKKLSVLVISRS